MDSESGEALDRLLTWEVLARYCTRFAAHQAGIEAQARRVQAAVCRVSAGQPLGECVRTLLAGAVLEPRARSG